MAAMWPASRVFIGRSLAAWKAATPMAATSVLAAIRVIQAFSAWAMTKPGLSASAASSGVKLSPA